MNIADELILLDNDKIVERGSYKKLIKNNRIKNLLR